MSVWDCPDCTATLSYSPNTDIWFCPQCPYRASTRRRNERHEDNKVTREAMSFTDACQEVDRLRAENVALREVTAAFAKVQAFPDDGQVPTGHAVVNRLLLEWAHQELDTLESA